MVATNQFVIKRKTSSLPPSIEGGGGAQHYRILASGHRDFASDYKSSASDQISLVSDHMGFGYVDKIQKLQRLSQVHILTIS